MNLLGAKLYDPSAAASKSTASLLGMTAIDTTNLRLTVTVPAHGFLWCRLRCALEGATTFPQILLGLLNGATVVARLTPSATVDGTALATTRAGIVAEFAIPGLTPGAITLDAAYGVEIGVASTNIKYGGPNNTTTDDAWGAFVFEIWDPQPISTAAQLALDGNGRVGVGNISGTAQTGRDLGASVLLSSGAGTGQVLLSAGHISNVDTVTTVTTATNLTNAPTAGDFTAAMKTSLNAATPASVQNISAQTGDSFARLGVAGVGLTNLGDARIANLDATVSSRLAPAGTLAAVTLVATTTNLTNAPTAGDLTATMKASVTTAATAATPTAAAVTGNVGGNVVGSVGSVVGLTAANLDVAVSTRTKPADTQAAVTLVGTTTNLTNAPTAGDFTAVMKTSLNAATPTVTVSGDFSATMKASLNASTPAAITGAVGSVTGSVGSVVGLNPALIDVAISTRFAAVSYTAPDNAGINFIAVLTNATLDATISSRTKPADTQAAVGTVNALAVSALADFFTVNSGSSYAASVAGSVVKEIVDNSGTSPVSVAAIVNGWGNKVQSAFVTPGTLGFNLDIPISASQADGPLIP